MEEDGTCAAASAVAITAGVQAKAGTEGASAGVSAGPATGKQAKTSYNKGMALLYMLRFELQDDDLFYLTLRNFLDRYANDVATGMDFKEVNLAYLAPESCLR